MIGGGWRDKISHALANPRRIKASHRRCWKRSTGHSVYANNNSYTFIDPDGRQAACTGSRVSCPSATSGALPRAELAKQAVGRDGRMMLRMFTAPVDAALSTYEAVRDGDKLGMAAAVVGIIPVGKLIKTPRLFTNLAKSEVVGDAMLFTTSQIGKFATACA